MSNVIFIFLRRMRMPLIALIMVYAVATLGLTLIPGVDNMGNPHYLSFFHAFYFVSFMGSTIGFGEIPYPFTDAQRAWVLVSIYTSVVAWLYTIGSLLNLFQDPALKRAVTFQSFRNTVKRQRDPFWIVCGLGGTGQATLERLVRNGIDVVVIDNDQDRLNDLEIADFGGRVPALLADMTVPDNLLAAGIAHPSCTGIVALAGDDSANLKVAVSASQLGSNPDLKVICRSENEDVARNMESFGTNVVINPFTIFTEQLGLAVHNLDLYTLGQWLTDNGETQLLKYDSPPGGRWILCGYGRLGKELQQLLEKQNIQTTIVDPSPGETDAPSGTVKGLGTEADTLEQAEVHSATGLVAATPDDADNLSIVMTANELNPDLFSIARLNSLDNDDLFRAANLNLIMRRNEVLADRILAIIDRPLVTRFLNHASQLTRAKIREVMAWIEERSDNIKPVTWRYTINRQSTPSIISLLDEGRSLRLGDLLHDTGQQPIAAIPLMLQTDSAVELMPEPDYLLAPGQQILFTGTKSARRLNRWLCIDEELLRQTLNPARHAIPLMRWLSRRRHRHPVQTAGTN